MDLLAWPAGRSKGMSMACASVVFAGWIGAELQAAAGGLPIWPATGVAAGIALARPTRAAGVALGLLATRFATGIPAGVAIAWGGLTAITVLAFVVAISHVERQHGRSGPWFPGLALLTAGCTAVLASKIGQTVHFVVESQSAAFTLHWLAGDLLSLLLITPTVRALLDRRQPRARGQSSQFAEHLATPRDRSGQPDPHRKAAAQRERAPHPPLHPASQHSPQHSSQHSPQQPPQESERPLQEAPQTSQTASQSANDRLHARPSMMSSAGFAHPIVAGAAYFVWDRAQNQVSAQENTLRQILDADDRDDDQADLSIQGEGHLDAATHHCHDWFRAAGPETRRAIRRALISLRRDRTPMDLRLPLKPTSLGRQASGRTLRLRLWGTYGSNGRLTHVHGILEDLRAEWLRVRKISELEQNLRQTHLALEKREQQAGKLGELLTILQHTHSEADHLLNDLDQAPESNLSDELADRTVDVAAAVRKALRITRRLAATDDSGLVRSDPSLSHNATSNVADSASSSPRAKISVAALLAECDEEDP